MEQETERTHCKQEREIKTKKTTEQLTHRQTYKKPQDEGGHTKNTMGQRATTHNQRPTK